MPAYEALDLLLQDIPGASPQGQDLKYSPLYDQIKEASREDLDLPQGVWVQDLKSASWGEVEKICLDILQNKSKDLQIASWLIEAWINLYNMKGLSQGFNLLWQLSQKYWDTGFPILDPKDSEFRAAPYNWINEKLSPRFNKIEVTSPDTPDLLSYSYSTYIDVQKDGGISITGAPDEESLPEKREGFEKSIEKTKDDFFIQLQSDGREALAFIKNLQTLLDDKLGTDSPSLYNAQEKVQELISFGEQTLESRSPQEETTIKLETEINPETLPSSPSVLTSSEDPMHIETVINSRSDAYSIIDKAANYLEKLDPHSPSPHLIKRAIRWSNLDLKELLQEMIRDQESLEDLKHLLGMVNNQDEVPTETQDPIEKKEA